MKKNNEKNGLFDIIVYAMMIIAIVYILIQTLLENNNTFFYKISLGIWILAALVISDFVEPLYMKKFEKMKQTKIQAYIKYAVADALMYVMVYMFIINVSFFKEPIHYVFLGVAIAMYPLRQWLYGKYNKLSDGVEGIMRKMDKESFETDYDRTEEDFEVNTFDEDDEIKVMILRNHSAQNNKK